VKKLISVLVAAFVGLFAFATVAAATSLAGAPAPAASSSPDGLSAVLDALRPIYDAFTGGHYLYAGMLALVLAVALTKRYLGPKVPWLHTDVGGSTLTLVGAFGAALAAALAGGGGVSWAMAQAALYIAVGAAGGYSLVKRLLVPPLRALAAKCPAWSQPIFALVFWIFDKPDAVAVAQAAGDAAVKAKPSTGVANTLGKPQDVE
jgi:hypothetical protein